MLASVLRRSMRALVLGGVLWAAWWSPPAGGPKPSLITQVFFFLSLTHLNSFFLLQHDLLLGPLPLLCRHVAPQGCLGMEAPLRYSARVCVCALCSVWLLCALSTGGGL